MPGAEGTKIHYDGGFRPEMTRSQLKTTVCGVDTIAYPYLKELQFTAPNDSFFVDAMVGSVRTAAQAYHIAAPIRVHGVQFWGGAYSTSPAPQTLQVRAYLYSVDAFNMPVAKLDSADVTVTNAYDFYEAVFAAPYTYGQNFAVAVRSVPNDTLAVITNNAGNVWSPNYGEALAWRRFGSGVWNSSLSFFGQDLEYMIFPIVSYDLSASYATDGPTECTDSEAAFDNTSSSLYSNRFLNLYAFDEYWGFAAADSSFTWDYSDGPDENATDGAHTYAAAGDYDVSLTGELMGYYNSCQDTYTETISVEPTPVAQAGVVGQVDLCDGSTLGVAGLPSTGVTYQWMMNGAAVPDSTNATFYITEAGVYGLIVENACGTDTSGMFTVNVVTAVTGGINTSGPVQFCEGGSVELQATPGSGVMYEWLMDGVSVADSTNGWFTASEAGDYAVIVSNVCGSDTSVVTTVTTDTPATAGLNISGALEFCEGGVVTLHALPAAGVTYTWLQNGLEVEDADTAGLNVTEGGSYMVVVSNTCGDDTTAAVTVIVNDLPETPVIMASGGYLGIDPGSVSGNPDYQWYLGGNAIPDATADTIVPAANGMYTVTVTNADGCSSTSAAFGIDNASLGEQAGIFLQIAPNPTNSVFAVSFTPGTLRSLTLFDVNGKVIATQLPEQTADVLVFDLSAYGSGVYLLRADGISDVRTERIVLEK